MKRLSDFREEYTQGYLCEKDMVSLPIEQFKAWLRQTIDAELPEPNAMTLATVAADGRPSARVVLLKEINDRGFVFFTNYMSQKGQELTANPFAALVFDWHELERQVRVEGRVEKLAEAESDAYFASRPVSSQIGAWASPQSSILADRGELERMHAEMQERYGQNPISRPPHWGGFIVLPTKVEFWQGRPNRLHDRIVYTLSDAGWHIHRLAP